MNPALSKLVTQLVALVGPLMGTPLRIWVPRDAIGRNAAISYDPNSRGDIWRRQSASVFDGTARRMRNGTHLVDGLSQGYIRHEDGRSVAVDGVGVCDDEGIRESVVDVARELRCSGEGNSRSVVRRSVVEEVLDGRVGEEVVREGARPLRKDGRSVWDQRSDTTGSGRT
jgi:hypothetical protein